MVRGLSHKAQCHGRIQGSRIRPTRGNIQEERNPMIALDWKWRRTGRPTRPPFPEPSLHSSHSPLPILEDFYWGSWQFSFLGSSLQTSLVGQEVMVRDPNGSGNPEPQWCRQWGLAFPVKKCPSISGGPGPPGFDCIVGAGKFPSMWLCYLLAEWPWTSYLTSLNHIQSPMRE